MSNLSNNRSRESLIYELNQALRGDELPDSKARVSHFDTSTGTMYCENDESYNKKKIEEAQVYFKSVGLMLRANNNPESYKKGEYCKIAEEAIGIMLSNSYVEAK